MVDLKAMYENAGLVIAANELPDYVPLFLEFLSTQPVAEARELLGQTAHILAALAERLGRAESSYRAVFDALVAITAEAPRRDIVNELLKAPDTDPMDLVGARCRLGRGGSAVRPGRKARAPAVMKA